MDPVWRRQWDRPRARPGVAINLQSPVSFCSLELRANVGGLTVPSFHEANGQFPTVGLWRGISEVSCLGHWQVFAPTGTADGQATE